MLGRRHKGDDDNASAFELLVDEDPEPLGSTVAASDEPEKAPENGADPNATLVRKIEQLTELITTTPPRRMPDVHAEVDALRQELTSALIAVSQRLHAALVDMGQRLSEETGELRAAVAALAGRPQAPAAGGKAVAPVAPSRELLQLVTKLDRKVDRLAELVAATPPPPPSALAGAGSELEVLRGELKNALVSMNKQLQSGLGKVDQRVADEVGHLRGALEAAVALLVEQPAGDRQGRLNALTSSNELIRSLLAEHRREMERLVAGGPRLSAELADEQAVLRAQLKTLLQQIESQRDEDRRERRTELRTALAKSAEAIRSVLVDERQELRSELRQILPDILRQRGDEWQELRAAYEEATADTRERTLALAQLSQRVSELRAELQATSGRAQDQFAQLRAEIATMAIAPAEGPLGVAGEDLLSRWEQLRASVEAAVAATADRTRLAVTQLGEQLAELRYELESTAARVGEQRTQEMAQLRSEISVAVSRMYDEQAAQWQQLRATLDAAADRSGERANLSITELGERVAEVRGEFHLRFAGLDEQVAHLGGEVDVRLGRLDEQFDEVRRARGDEFRELLSAVEGTIRRDRAELAEAIDGALERDRSELARGIEEATRQQASDQAELRNILASTIEAANEALVTFRDDLYERLDTIVDVTAQSSASAAASVKALRRDLEEIDKNSSLHDALDRLRDDIETLRKKMPARVALYLPESQLATIVEAVQRHEPPPAPAPAPGRAVRSTKRVPAAKKAAAAKKSASRRT